MGEQGPEPLTNILARLFAQRGWGRRSGRRRLEEAWNECVGERYRNVTRVLGLKRGILEVEVLGSAYLHELAAFRKKTLIAKMRERLAEPIRDIRFRAAG